MGKENNKIFKPLGASNHTEGTREKNDYYATDPKAVRMLLELEKFNPRIWECACGEGHISEVLIQKGYNVRSTDLISRGYSYGGFDFLKTIDPWNGDIVTNPPYEYAKEFVEKALELITDGNKIAMFLKIQFLEGKTRRELFDLNPPKIVYISSSRLACAKNGDFKDTTKAMAFAWFIWEKGFDGITQLKWFN